MKLKLAILLCKILRFVGGLIGKGSSLPGQFALKVCPDVLGRVKLPEKIIAVTGSNGKTSTVEMIAAILTADGKKVVYNKGNYVIGAIPIQNLTYSFGGNYGSSWRF